MLGGLVPGLFGLLVLFGIFWLCRELFCWYWKFNRMVELAEAQRQDIAAIRGLLARLVEDKGGAPGVGAGGTPQ